MKNNSIFSFGIVYKLGLLRLFLFAIIFSPILLYSFNLYITIFIILFIIFLLFLRFFYFHESHLEISFLFKFIKRKDIILYENLKSVIYKYGQYGGMPVVIIKPIRKDWKYHIYDFFICRFTLGKRNKVISLFRFLNKKNIEIVIFSESNSKQDIVNQIFGNVPNGNVPNNHFSK